MRHIGTKSKRLAGALVLVGLIAASSTLPVAANNLTTVTLATPGLAGKGLNYETPNARPQPLSADGRILVYASPASNIVPGDTNNSTDIFAYDRVSKQTELISGTRHGGAGNKLSYSPSVSADGRYVAFATQATDLTPTAGPACLHRDPCINLVVYDRVMQRHTLINRDNTGRYVQVVPDDTAISANGRHVVFSTPDPINAADTNGVPDVAVVDLETLRMEPVNVDNNSVVGPSMSLLPSMSRDGRLVAFATASPLVANDTNSIPGDELSGYDFYVRDTWGGQTKRVSVADNGRQIAGPTLSGLLSADGSSFVFGSFINGIVAADTNDQADVFVHHLASRKTKLVSFGNGVPGNGSSFPSGISGDGKYVTFTSTATNLTPLDGNSNRPDAYIYYRDYAITRRVNKNDPARSSAAPIISDDGRVIAFTMWLPNPDPSSEFKNVSNIYLWHNPVVHIPYYDDDDFLNLLR